MQLASARVQNLFIYMYAHSYQIEKVIYKHISMLFTEYTQYFEEKYIILLHPA